MEAVEKLPARRKLCWVSPAAKPVTSIPQTTEMSSHAPIPKAFPPGKWQNRKRMVGTKRQKIVLQTGDFISKEQPELRMCPTVHLSTSLTSLEPTVLGPGGCGHVAEWSTLHLGP